MRRLIQCHTLGTAIGQMNTLNCSTPLLPWFLQVLLMLCMARCRSSPNLLNRTSPKIKSCLYCDNFFPSCSLSLDPRRCSPASVLKFNLRLKFWDSNTHLWLAHEPCPFFANAWQHSTWSKINIPKQWRKLLQQYCQFGWRHSKCFSALTLWRMYPIRTTGMV